MLQAGPVIGTAVSLASGQPWWQSAISNTSKFASTFFPEGETVESNFRRLSKILESQKCRFLMIIDDIDRLSPDEALAIFRLVKSVGRLPNVMYLLVFDRQLAEKAVMERYPSEGPHFLEKIIQAGFELPPPTQTDLNEAVLHAIDEICGSPGESQIVRTMNIFYDVVAPYITTPRHVTRLQNAVSVTWPAIAKEVNLADFIALEAIRLYEPGLFSAIRLRRAELCGVRQGNLGRSFDERFEVFLKDLPESRHELAKISLQRLFPKLERVGYDGEWIPEWSSERRVCVDTHCDTYFRLSLADGSLPFEQIQELISHAEDLEFVQNALRNAAATERKRGKSMVPVYLDSLRTEAGRVEKSKVEPLLTALFEIHDEIDLEKDADSGFMGMANTSLRFHWLIRRLTKNRFSIDERTALYDAATQRASLGWLVDFVSSARHNYQERENRLLAEEDCLVSRDFLELFTNRALKAIRSAAEDRSLLSHKDLISILYRWREFLDDNPEEVRSWTDSLLNEDNALVILARALTTRSWSMSMGDRIATAGTSVQISDDTDIFDLKRLRASLERIRNDSMLDPESLDVVRTFLEAWDRTPRSMSSAPQVGA